VGNINIDTATNNAILTIKRVGKVPMPVDVLVTYKDGTQELHYIPMNLMYGQKPAEGNIPRTVQQEWRWTHPEYTFMVNRKVADIKSVEIDASYRMADLNRSNNKLVIPD
jgi:hypothetical protein